MEENRNMKERDTGTERTGRDGNRHDRLDGIELRSEKMREVMGDIPRGLVGATVAVLVILTVALVAAAILIPSPYQPGVSIFRHLMNVIAG